MNEEQFNDLGLEDLQKQEVLEQILKDYRELDGLRAKPTSVVNFTPETLSIKENDVLVFRGVDDSEIDAHVHGLQAIASALKFQRVNVIFIGEDEEISLLDEVAMKGHGWIRDPEWKPDPKKPICAKCGKGSDELAVAPFGFEEGTGARKFSSLCPECRNETKS